MHETINESGNVYGKWIVLSKYKSTTSSAAWLCRCECGYERPILGVDLRRNKLPLCTNCCRVCGKTRNETEFKGNKRICKECDKRRIKEWKTATNYQKQYMNPWLKRNPEAVARHKETERDRLQSDPYIFLCYKLKDIRRKIKRADKNLSLGTKQRSRLIDREVTITEEELIALWDKQNGLCAISGMPMAHEFKNLRSASIDRIDSSKGYVPGNVQLVCQWVNYAKNNHADAEIREVLAEYGKA